MSPKYITEEQKALNKEIRRAKQRAWFLTEEGILFKERQANAKRKYATPKERDISRNQRRKEQFKTDLDMNLRNRVSACRQRAKRDDIPFNLDFEYIKSIYTDTCPYLGIKLNLRASSGNSMDAISIDKIVPELGYVKGNVQIISYKANVMKQDVSLDTLCLFARRVLEMHGSEGSSDGI